MKGISRYQQLGEEDSLYDETLCAPLEQYTTCVKSKFLQLNLFPNEKVNASLSDIKVVELFAGVGGFRIGLERASKKYVTIWNNQWEPSTKRQDASYLYCKHFGTSGHSNIDIAEVPISDIPECDLLVGGFPCQDYSVATTLKNSWGIEGKKGVLWWQIHRILREYKNKPRYLFLENVDRLLKSPASQRGRDFAIILASLSDLGYTVEWRIINAADYGMPQRRRRTYIVAYLQESEISKKIESNNDYWKWLTDNGTIAMAFPCQKKNDKLSHFFIEGDLEEVSDNFNKGKGSIKTGPFGNTGIMTHREVFSLDTDAVYDGPFVTLGQILVNEKDVPEDFFITDEEIHQWKYLKGSKSESRTNKSTGYEYHYSEGSMAFPDYLDKPSRTIITGEGGKGASRFKHIVLTPSGRYRRLIPIELERLDMFPDNHTKGDGVSDLRRAFLMGNALVTGVIEGIGRSLIMMEKVAE